MGPIDAFWHVMNFLAPAPVVAALTAMLAKVLWRRELRSAPWIRLFAWSSVMGMLALGGALSTFGHDGTMAGYGLLILAVALTVWLAILIPKGFFPQQDTGLIIGVSECSMDASFDQMVDRQRALTEVLVKDPGPLMFHAEVLRRDGVAVPPPPHN